MKAKEARQLIGKRVKYVLRREMDRDRGYVERFGYVQDVEGRNVMINDDWMWLPDFWRIEQADKPDGKL